MHHSTQKRKLTEHLRGIYYILRTKQYIITPYCQFSKDWQDYSYSNGLNGLCVDLLYSIIIGDNTRLIGVANRIISEGIETFLNGEFISGKVIKPTKGMSLLCWDMLEKLQQNDMEYFDTLKNIIQKQNLEKKKKHYKKLDI